MTKKFFSMMIFALAMMSIFSSCKKDKKDETPDPTGTAKYVLLIENGAMTVAMDQNITYSAVLIDANGAVTPATGVSWTSSNTQIATINSGGVLTVAGTGSAKITASISKDGLTYTASVPVGVITPSIFAVAPSAIIYEKGGSLQLETVYFSPTGGNPSYTYTSSNAAVATVSSSGLVNFVEVGECSITVTANLNGNPQFIVPVLVIGVPAIELPVTRIAVNPPSGDLFRGETLQLNAKAYKSDGTEVTGKTFTWTSVDPSIATVSTTGLVTPINPGTAHVHATTDGIVGYAEIVVNPDTLVWLTPFSTSIPQNGSKQFTATAYRITRTTQTLLTGITFHWEIPTYGFPMFDIATVNATGLVTMKSNATPGMMTFVAVWDQANPNAGAASSIQVAIAEDCDCGAGNPDVSSIQVSNGNTINMTMMSGTVQLNITALDAIGGTVTNPALVLCSDNVQVANVSSDGIISAIGEGTAIIKICSGTYAEKTITVNVTLM